MQLAVNILGYIGSGMLLLAFIFVTRNVWKPQSKIYLSVNLIGALFLAIYQIALGAYAGVLLNIIFATVAATGLYAYWNVNNNKMAKKSKRK